MVPSSGWHASALRSAPDRFVLHCTPTTKAVILAGGLGTRISEETHLKPKPMVEIGGKPILWHILKIYSAHGINEFVICCGYKGYVIKEYFANYFLHMSDVTFHAKRCNKLGEMLVHCSPELRNAMDEMYCSIGKLAVSQSRPLCEQFVSTIKARLRPAFR